MYVLPVYIYATPSHTRRSAHTRGWLTGVPCAGRRTLSAPTALMLCARARSYSTHPKVLPSWGILLATAS